MHMCHLNSLKDAHSSFRTCQQLWTKNGIMKPDVVAEFNENMVGVNNRKSI